MGAERQLNLFLSFLHSFFAHLQTKIIARYSKSEATLGYIREKQLPTSIVILRIYKCVIAIYSLFIINYTAVSAEHS